MFLPLADPLVATFSERDAPNFRKYVAEIRIMMENPSKTLETFWSHWSVLLYIISIDMEIFRVFLVLTDPLAATFNERGALTSRKYIVELDIMIPNGSKTLKTF